MLHMKYKGNIYSCQLPDLKIHTWKYVLFLHRNTMKYFYKTSQFCCILGYQDIYKNNKISDIFSITHSLFVWIDVWYPFYMGFYLYINWYWYLKRANIGQNGGPCRPMNFQNMELARYAHKVRTNIQHRGSLWYRKINRIVNRHGCTSGRFLVRNYNEW